MQIKYQLAISIQNKQILLHCDIGDRMPVCASCNPDGHTSKNTDHTWGGVREEEGERRQLYPEFK